MPLLVAMFSILLGRASASEAAGGTPSDVQAERASSPSPRYVLASVTSTCNSAACPRYNLHIFDDGMVQYTAAGRGTTKSRLGSEKLDELRRAFENTRFFDLPTSYPGPLDAQTVTIFYRQEGRVKQVSFAPGYSAVPGELSLLQARIEEIGGLRDHGGTLASASRRRLLASVRTSPCMGKCSVYTVNVHEDGTVVCSGAASIKGAKESQLLSGQLKELEDAFEDARFFDLAAAYPVLLDAQRVTIYYARGGRSKTATYSPGDRAVPRELAALRERVERILGLDTAPARN